MNNRPVEQALGTLVPTHANDIPQELLSLALSLVAQSRSLSASLKPEEEIARPYACAEIACKRLTRALKLPPLLGRPPCPPRAYKKLYSYLDRSLTSSTAGTKRSASDSAPGTPSRTGSTPSTPTKESRPTRTPSKATIATPRGLQNTPSKSTPLKKSTTRPESPSASRTPRSFANFRSNGISGASIVPDAPAWVMNSIRTVCKTLSTPAPRTSTWSRPPISRTLPPHVFAGVSSVLYFVSKVSANEGESDELDEDMLEFVEPVMLAKDREKDEDFKELVDALIVAVYFLVLARRRTPSPSSTEVPSGEEARKMDKKTFSEMRQTALTSLGLPTTERRHRDDVDQWIALIMEQSWANGKEWFENIPQAGELDGDEAYLSDVGADEDDGGLRDGKRPKMMGKGRASIFSKATERGGLLPGLGTMMQDRVDYLSDDRREDFVEWKADLMARIEQMERTAPPVA
ncbi:hypothetical protein P170DRAFT_510365 [Aspergillus steynii IBT 23096]|uniref:ORC6 first cyclin-like domain-containing protein n=1 Tax=Aspergillus steynii IBT 23096 TaxID=1392250 RepID=A0A2I2G3S3_9EURO|nr:uncharacterized protein P170DRAFT_510365 [Aspergillus steynii IBT 23096]PLB47536.1 hypothetical protein P170DRAFT_510365 [Aspergillus steynii IBT 23096]